MINEIANAFLEPLTQTHTWYGVLLALAFTKRLRALGDAILGPVKSRLPSPERE